MTHLEQCWFLTLTVQRVSNEGYAVCVPPRSTPDWPIPLQVLPVPPLRFRKLHTAVLRLSFGEPVVGGGARLRKAKCRKGSVRATILRIATHAALVSRRVAVTARRTATVGIVAFACEVRAVDLRVTDAPHLVGVEQSFWITIDVLNQSAPPASPDHVFSVAA